MPDLVKTLEKETGVALSWLENNDMIANPEKFHAILLKKMELNLLLFFTGDGALSRECFKLCRFALIFPVWYLDSS